MNNPHGTYQTRLTLSLEQEAFLNTAAGRYNHVERCLYADMRRTGKKAASFKNEYLIKHSITSKQFNAIAIMLDGKISSALELLKLHKQETEARITKAKKVLTKIRNKDTKHQKKRKLHSLGVKLADINQQIADQDPRICFGSKKLFKKQYHLKENGYASSDQWYFDWDEYRNSQFFVIGSKDENAGCVGCVASENQDGTFNLRIRSLSKVRGYLFVENVSIPYGQDIIRQALQNKQAISYRFLRDDKSWKVLISTGRQPAPQLSIKASGAFGIDINVDCLAVSETDRFGNLINSWVLPLVTYGKSTDQAEAIIGDVVKQVVALAEIAKKPIVVEKLNFSKKKAELEGENPRYARMLSSFSCNKIVQNIKSRAFKFGIKVIEVNPAYTSTIGAVNYAQRYGISTHQAAAIVIARRGLGLSEKAVTRTLVPVRNCSHVTFPVPVRKFGTHVWKQWHLIGKALKAELAAHFLSGGHKRPPAPLREALATYTRANELCPTRTLSAKSRHANRQFNCSTGVVDDIPW